MRERERENRERNKEFPEKKSLLCLFRNDMTQSWCFVPRLLRCDSWAVIRNPYGGVRMYTQILSFWHPCQNKPLQNTFYPFSFLQISKGKEKWKHAKWPTPWFKGLSEETCLLYCNGLPVMLGTKGWVRTGLYYHRTLSGLRLANRWSPGLIDSINSSHYVIKDEVWWAEMARLGCLRC